MTIFKSWKQFETAVLASDCFENADQLEQMASQTTTASQAFALAYQGAILQLEPKLNPHHWAAFCVSEVSGNHPKQLQTRAMIDRQGNAVLTGEKTFVTHGKHVGQLLVVAKSHDAHEDGKLRAYRLDRHQQGVEIKESRAAGILPELDHGKLVLQQAKAVCLPGDGHSDYSKRFRLLEDQYMLATFCWHISAQANRFGLAQALIDQAAVIAQKVRFLSNMNAKSIIELSTLYDQFMQLSQEYQVALEGYPEVQQAWQRDRKLFLLAKQARDLRTEKAKNSLIPQK